MTFVVNELCCSENDSYQRVLQIKKTRKGLFWILVIDGDYPSAVVPLNLENESDRTVLARHLCRSIVCQFKDKESYIKGKRLFGQHKSGLSIRIGKFQRLVEPLGYQRLPLPSAAKKIIRRDFRLLGLSVTKLAGDWDVSESHIRSILNKDKPPVSSSGDPRKQVFLEGQPPVPSRVVAEGRGYLT